LQKSALLQRNLRYFRFPQETKGASPVLSKMFYSLYLPKIQIIMQVLSQKTKTCLVCFVCEISYFSHGCSVALQELYIYRFFKLTLQAAQLETRCCCFS